MTPDQLPPLPEPETLGSSRFGSLFKGHTDAAMTAYGLQCAEAAVERERARCREAVASMRRQLRLDDPSETLRQCHGFAANLLDFIIEDIDGASPAELLRKSGK